MMLHPIFRDHNVEELAELTGYRAGYLLNMKEGKYPVTPRFRRKMAAALGRPEGELFLEPEPAAA